MLAADLYKFAKSQGPGYIERLVAEDKKRLDLELEKPGPALAVSKLLKSDTPDKAEEPAGPGGSDTKPDIRFCNMCVNAYCEYCGRRGGRSPGPTKEQQATFVQWDDGI